MQVHNPLDKQYLCSTCLTPFASNQAYKEHYKSDFHRYNIKRKMVKLPPVTLQQFSTKLQDIKIDASSKFQCNQCRKQFASAQTLNQHVASKGHNPHIPLEIREKVVPVPLVFAKDARKCLFCSAVAGSGDENERHMEAAHGFFIAQKEFCKNRDGLIEYLQEKVEVGNLCIFCENKKAKDFQSADAVRKHMTDRGHTFMKTEDGFEEYEKYYDFSRLFEEKLKEQNKIVPGIDFQKVKVLVDDEEEAVAKAGADEDEWEDEEDGDEEWESDDEEEETNEPRQKIREETRKQRVKTYNIMKPTLTANDELLLPNGKILGHRKYRYLYRQTLRAPHWFASQLKQLTMSSPAIGNAIVDRRALLQIIKKETMAKSELVRNKKYNLHLGLTTNDLMRHFRSSNPL